MISPEGPSSPAEAFPERYQLYEGLRERAQHDSRYKIYPPDVAHIYHIHKPFEGWRPRQEVHPSVRLWDDLSLDEVDTYWQLEEQALARTQALFDGREPKITPEGLTEEGALHVDYSVTVPLDLGNNSPFTDVFVRPVIHTLEHDDDNNLSIDVTSFELVIEGRNTERTEKFDGRFWVDALIVDGLTWVKATDRALRALRNPAEEVPDLQVGGLQIVRLMEYYDMLRFVEEHAVRPEPNS